MGVSFNKKRHLLILMLLMTFGSILRFYDLGAESIWLDEGYSISVSKLDFFQVLKIEDDFPPLYYLLLHGWIKLFGDSEFSVRFPSLIFGVLSMGAIYKTGTLLFDAKKGLISAFVLAVSLFHIHYCQEARPYSLTAFLAIVSMYGLVKCNQQWRWRSAAVYVLSSALLIYSHVIGLFLLIAQNFYVMTLFLFFRNDLNLSLKRWAVMQCTIGLLYLPWVPVFFARIFDDIRGSWMSVPGINDIRITYRKLVGGVLFKLSPLLVLASIISMNAIKLTGGWGPFFRSLIQFRPQLISSDVRQNYLLSLWLLFPVAIPFVLSQVMTPLFQTRYAIIAAPAFYLLIASGIGNIRHVAVRALVIGFICFVSLINVFNYYHKTTKIDWRGAAQHIQQFVRPQDMLILNSGTRRALAFNYYFNSKDLDRIVSPEGPERLHKDHLKLWTDLASGHERVWAVLTDRNSDRDLITHAIGLTHDQIYALNYRGVRLYLFQHRNMGQPAL